ncbi:MAG: VCBS repeat-containing protein, partial [Acidobacteriaceae bacterium]|nr:VCBS repeat-containing protein [Acidobacteriaceae bacterium]
MGFRLLFTPLLLFSIFSASLSFAGTAKQSARVPADPYPATSEHSGPAWFIDVAKQAGLTMQNVNGDADTKEYIIETTGSGVAIIDYDHDGWPDIFLVNGTTLDGKSSPTSHLYHNNHDGTFTDVTSRAGLNASGWGQGVCVGDYDNDGYDD